MLTSGTSIIWPVGCASRRSVRTQSSDRRGTSRAQASNLPGTLLGPEGSSDAILPRTMHLPRTARLRRVRDDIGWYRPYLENYIVDASIFVAIL